MVSSTLHLALMVAAFANFCVYTVVRGDTIQCYKGEFTPAVITSSVATSNLCQDCRTCMKIVGTRGGAQYTLRDCGCKNTFSECSSKGTMNVNINGITGTAYCCNSNRCNAAGRHVSLPLIAITALFGVLWFTKF